MAVIAKYKSRNEGKGFIRYINNAEFAFVKIESFYRRLFVNVPHHKKM